MEHKERKAYNLWWECYFSINLNAHGHKVNTVEILSIR